MARHKVTVPKHKADTEDVTLRTSKRIRKVTGSSCSPPQEATKKAKPNKSKIVFKRGLHGVSNKSRKKLLDEKDASIFREVGFSLSEDKYTHFELCLRLLDMAASVHEATNIEDIAIPATPQARGKWKPWEEAYDITLSTVVKKYRDLVVKDVGIHYNNCMACELSKKQQGRNSQAVKRVLMPVEWKALAPYLREVIDFFTSLYFLSVDGENKKRVYDDAIRKYSTKIVKTKAHMKNVIHGARMDYKAHHCMKMLFYLLQPTASRSNIQTVITSVTLSEDRMSVAEKTKEVLVPTIKDAELIQEVLQELLFVRGAKVPEVALSFEETIKLGRKWIDKELEENTTRKKGVDDRCVCYEAMPSDQEIKDLSNLAILETPEYVDKVKGKIERERKQLENTAAKTRGLNKALATSEATVADKKKLAEAAKALIETDMQTTDKSRELILGGFVTRVKFKLGFFDYWGGTSKEEHLRDYANYKVELVRNEGYYDSFESNDPIYIWGIIDYDPDNLLGYGGAFEERVLNALNIYTTTSPELPEWSVKNYLREDKLEMETVRNHVLYSLRQFEVRYVMSKGYTRANEQMSQLCNISAERCSRRINTYRKLCDAAKSAKDHYKETIITKKTSFDLGAHFKRSSEVDCHKAAKTIQRFLRPMLPTSTNDIERAQFQPYDQLYASAGKERQYKNWKNNGEIDFVTNEGLYPNMPNEFVIALPKAHHSSLNVTWGKLLHLTYTAKEAQLMQSKLKETICDLFGVQERGDPKAFIFDLPDPNLLDDTIDGGKARACHAILERGCRRFLRALYETGHSEWSCKLLTMMTNYIVAYHENINKAQAPPPPPPPPHQLNDDVGEDFRFSSTDRANRDVSNETLQRQQSTSTLSTTFQKTGGRLSVMVQNPVSQGVSETANLQFSVLHAFVGRAVAFGLEYDSRVFEISSHIGDIPISPKTTETMEAFKWVPNPSADTGEAPKDAVVKAALLTWLSPFFWGTFDKYIAIFNQIRFAEEYPSNVDNLWKKQKPSSAEITITKKLFETLKKHTKEEDKIFQDMERGLRST